MNKIIAYAVISLVIICGYYFSVTRQETENIGSHFVGTIINSATTTSTALPVKILEEKADRNYALITNDSDTVVYLHFGYFVSNLAASTTVSLNKGVRLNADGGTFEINDNNLYTGQIWATSTAANKKLIYVEN